MVPDVYKAHGNKPVILQGDLNVILNFIGKQEPTKIVGEGKEVENGFTVKQIFQNAFNLSDVDISVRNCYVENYFDLDALMMVEEHLDENSRQEIDCDTLINYYEGWFKSLATQYVVKALDSICVNYSKSYYSYSDFTYDEEEDQKLIKPSFKNISEEEFNVFKDERKKYRESLADDLKRSEKDSEIKKKMEELYNYSQVFEKYVFSDNKKLINDDFDIVECNQRLEERLIRLATERQNKYEVDGDPNPVEFVTFRLKKFDEYALFCEKFYNKLFKINAHDTSNEGLYDSRSNPKNNVCYLLESYRENRKLKQKRDKEKIVKKVYLSDNSKELFNDRQINDMYILSNVGIFARIVENYYEHTEESYEAYKETSCKKIKELGKQKLNTLPKKIREQLENRYLEKQKEPSWLEFLEEELSKSKNDENQLDTKKTEYNHEDTKRSAIIVYEQYDRNKEIENRKQNERLLEELKGSNSHESKLRELGLEDSEVYRYPKLFVAVAVISNETPFTKGAYRKYRETKDLKLKQLGQQKINAISKNESGKCAIKEFELDYEREEKECFNKKMSQINWEIENLVHEGDDLETKLSTIDFILEGDKRYFSEELFNNLKRETDKIKREISEQYTKTRKFRLKRGIIKYFFRYMDLNTKN